jgi:hypothetical protein
MRLTTWHGRQVRKADIVVAKNYLTELNRLTMMFLDFAEDRASRRQQISMAEWVTRTDSFLSFNERGVLTNAGGISASDAEAQVSDIYADYDSRRRQREAAEAQTQEERDLAALVELERRGRPTNGDHDDG